MPTSAWLRIATKRAARFGVAATIDGGEVPIDPVDPPPAGPTALRLRPPALTNPTSIDIPDTGGTVDLYGADKDWIINLPSVPVPTFSINGRSAARHVVVIGGAVKPPNPRSDLSTMRRLDGVDDWAVYAKRGFTGATGGTWFIYVEESSTGPRTANIAWDATAAQVKAAIEAVSGAGACKAVDGPDTPGGPWKIVPADARLGRVKLSLTGLTGPKVATPTVNEFSPAYFGMAVKLTKGIVHLEGLEIGGPNCNEAININCPYDESVVQFANMHVSAEFYMFHKTWHHPDALQAYNGPCEMRMDTVDLISCGSQAMIMQPRETSSPIKLQGLRDGWYRNVLFLANPNLLRSPQSTPGNPALFESDWPVNANQSLNWYQRMDNCWASRIDLDGSEVIGGLDKSWGDYANQPLTNKVLDLTGLPYVDVTDGYAIRAQPPGGFFCDPAEDQCGVNYDPPGYGGAAVESGVKRLQGEIKLT